MKMKRWFGSDDHVTAAAKRDRLRKVVIALEEAETHLWYPATSDRLINLIEHARERAVHELAEAEREA